MADFHLLSSSSLTSCYHPVSTMYLWNECIYNNVQLYSVAVCRPEECLFLPASWHSHLTDNITYCFCAFPLSLLYLVVWGKRLWTFFHLTYCSKQQTQSFQGKQQEFAETSRVKEAKWFNPNQLSRLTSRRCCLILYDTCTLSLLLTL